MADLADLSDAAQGQILDAAVEAARCCKPVAEATGECLFCGEPLPPTRRWCDAGCRDDWQWEQDAVQQKAGER